MNEQAKRDPGTPGDGPEPAPMTNDRYMCVHYAMTDPAYWEARLNYLAQQGWRLVDQQARPSNLHFRDSAAFSVMATFEREPFTYQHVTIAHLPSLRQPEALQNAMLPFTDAGWRVANIYQDYDRTIVTFTRDSPVPQLPVEVPDHEPNPDDPFADE